MDVIKFAKVKEGAIIPSKLEENAGYDIYACFDDSSDDIRVIQPHTTKLIPTGIASALPSKYYFQVEERGSTGSKGIKKSAGVIDSGYRGEIFIAITNTNNVPVVFGNEEEIKAKALNEMAELQSRTYESLTPEEVEEFKEYLLAHSIINKDNNEEEIKESINTILQMVMDDEAKDAVLKSIESSIFYPDTKAIAQLVLHEVPVVEIEEISFEELKQIPSERKDGVLGSSNK